MFCKTLVVSVCVANLVFARTILSSCVNLAFLLSEDFFTRICCCVARSFRPGILLLLLLSFVLSCGGVAGTRLGPASSACEVDKIACRTALPQCCLCVCVCIDVYFSVGFVFVDM